ncbi:MAG: efflux transporter periplasmic adaptor subunit [Cyanobacteria bacterium SW_6_48_11]|nr:MAG: efflux transporter periplasmic adaptor subunit [Cyanobacteria bacterium SW_6_48_11]
MSPEQKRNSKQNSLATTEKSNNQPVAYRDTTPKNDTDSPEKTPSKLSKRSQYKKAWWLVPLLGVVLVIGGVAVMRIRNNTGEETVTTTQTAPLSVGATAAEIEPIRAWISSEGTVQAARLKHLTFDVAGDVTYITNREGRPLREGDRVQKGELLARIDARNLLADKSKAQAAIVEAQKEKSAAAAEVGHAQAQVAQARSQVRQNQAQVEKAQSALELAQSELERYRVLYNEGAISASAFNSRQKAVRDARAEVRAAQASVASAEAQVRASQTQVKAAQQQLEATESGITNARAQLTQAEVASEGTRLYAPFDGIVAYLNIRENQYYTPQSLNSQLGGDSRGGNMTSIDDFKHDLKGVSDTVLGDLDTEERSEPDSNTASRNANQNETLVERARARGKVVAVNPAVSPGGRSIQATIRITAGTANLQHGDRVSTWIAVEQKSDAVVAPLNAFVFRDQKPYVFVVNQEEGSVEQRSVELGIEGIKQQEIQNGVKPGELVVTEGQNRLVDETPVEVNE